MTGNFRLARVLSCLAAMGCVLDCRADPTSMGPQLVEDPTPAHFSVCYEYGCKSIATVGLELEQWQEIRGLFAPEGMDAEQERKAIAQAIGHMEQAVGKLTGTSSDIGGTFPGTFRVGQMDCIDESTNATTYLKIFQHENLLHWHKVAESATRGWFLFGWPHTTAAIRDKTTHDLYAVDSWFLDNGQPATVVPLAIWKEGFKPGPAP